MPRGGKQAPGPPWYEVLRLLKQLRRDPLVFRRALHERYGDVVRVRFGAASAYLLRRPEHALHVLRDNHVNYDKDNVHYRVLKPIVGSGLLTSNGALWRRQRQAIQPAFQRERVEAMIPLMAARTEEMLAGWRRAGAADRDISRDMARLTLEVVTQALFGIDAGESAAEIGDSFRVLSRRALERVGSLSARLGFFSMPEKRPVKEARRRLHAVVAKLIAERRRRPPGADLLSKLLEARDEESGRAMSEAQLQDEVTTLLLAGHETTANALSWTFYLLSEHPEAARAVEDEVDRVLGAEAPIAASAARLNWCRAVLQESMRLYPPAWLVSRSAIEEDVIGGYAVGRRALVSISIYDTHRLPDFWPEPEKFDPRRFLDNHDGAAPFAYYPFGGGPRMCIGAGLAALEMVCILAAVARQCRLRLVPGQTVRPEAQITLRPRGGLRMTVEWR